MVARPYHQTVRQFKDGLYISRYIRHKAFADAPSRYIRGFELIQKDLLTLFEYIEPSRHSSTAYSFRTYELLLRVCTELEANFKSILRANTYAKNSKDLTIADYYKINSSHFLSEYSVEIPHWDGLERHRRPFKAWAKSRGQLEWYDAYNKAKHDRVQNLNQASFKNLINAVCGLVVVLTAQYLDGDLGLYPSAITDEGQQDGYESAVGGFFRVQYPVNIPTEERYDFDWQGIQNEANPFQKFNYDNH